MMSFIFHTMRASISSSEHQNFPSDGIWFLLTTGYPGEPKHLGDPRECIIDMTAGGGEADRSLSTGIREGAFVLGSRLTPLSVTSTKGYISFALEKTALLARRFHSRDNWAHQEWFTYLKLLWHQQGRQGVCTSVSQIVCNPAQAGGYFLYIPHVHSRLPFPLDGAFYKFSCGPCALPSTAFLLSHMHTWALSGVLTEEEQ